jgi:hypothetical protein
MAREYDSTEYRKNRRIVLEGSPMCAYCRRRKADTVDHVVEVDRGGDSSLSNLVPCCRTCNSRKGQDYLTRKNASRLAGRDAAVEAAETQRANARSFLDDTPLPPRATRKEISLEEQEGTEKTGHDLGESPPIGRDTPRLSTSGYGEDSFGPLVVEWARKFLGVDLFPWQRLHLDALLAKDPRSILAGDPVPDLYHRESFAGTGRQQGKTTLAAALLGWWLTDFAGMRGKPQSVLNSAHKLHRAEDVARLLFPILEEYFGGKPMWSAGRMTCTLPDRSKWEVSAAVPSSAHGGSYDLIVADEVWSVAPTVVFDGYRPSQIARKSPLLAMYSTAGDESSTLLLQLREQGLAAIDSGKPSRSLFQEWSIPPEVDPMDRRYWGYPNPSLGRSITMEALELAAAGPDKSSFMRGHLNVYLASAKSWLPSVGAWEKCQFDGPIPSGGILAIDSSVDSQRFVGVRSAPFEDGTVGTTVEFIVDNEPEMWREVERVLEDRTVKLAVTPTLELHVPEHYKERSTVVGHGEISKYTSLVRTMIAEKRIRSTREEMFHQHVARAVGVKTSTGFIVSSQKSVGPIELCRVMIWSVALASVPVRTRKPTIASAKR